jgi:hypothetical protein
LGCAEIRRKSRETGEREQGGLRRRLLKGIDISLRPVGVKEQVVASVPDRGTRGRKSLCKGLGGLERTQKATVAGAVLPQSTGPSEICLYPLHSSWHGAEGDKVAALREALEHGVCESASDWATTNLYIRAGGARGEETRPWPSDSSGRSGPGKILPAYLSFLKGMRLRLGERGEH